MAGKGGYQRPTDPAVSSGPGALAQRTDGGPASKQAARYMSGGEYGDGQEMMNIQQSAPMEAAPEVKPMTPSEIAETGAAQKQQVLSLMDPTQYPDRPVTHGIDSGPGAGSEAMPVNFAGTKSLQNNPLAVKYFPDLFAAASIPGAPDSYRQFVNYLAGLI